MKKIALFLSGIFAALTVASFAVTGGGLPSQPTFQAISVKVGASTYLKVDTSGNITAPNAIAVPWLTQTTGSFTATLALGCTTTPTATINYVKTGQLVTMWWASNIYNCTSNTTGKTTDASLPASIRPTTTKCASGMFSGEDNTTATSAIVQVTSSGTLNYAKGFTGTGQSLCGTGTNWTGSGTFSLDGTSITYTLQ